MASSDLLFVFSAARPGTSSALSPFDRAAEKTKRMTVEEPSYYKQPTPTELPAGPIPHREVKWAADITSECC
jgi:hypothetical protein